MADTMKRSWIADLGVAVLVAALPIVSAMAQTEDNTRAVRVIDAPMPAPSPAPSSSPAAIPGSGLPQLVAPPPSAPGVGMPPAASSPAHSAPSAAITPVPVPAASPPASQSSRPLPPPQVNLSALDASIKVANPAAVSVDILPGPEIAVGSRVSFRVSTKKPGYLILVDVDAAGKLTQIYPNMSSLKVASADRTNANYVKPGKPVQIPNPAEAFAFEFVASPPLGTAMVVAILSDRPVQMVDLPDVPATITGQAAALDFLTKLAGELRIPQGDGGRLQEPRWSFDAKFYAIR